MHAKVDAPSRRAQLPRDLSPFEEVYRANVGAISAYFGRRCRDPHTVADLTSDTFVRAIGSFSTFDAHKGTARSWLFGIATRVYASHCEQASGARDAALRLTERRSLEVDEIEELVTRIDAEQAGRLLVMRFSGLPDVEAAAVELVDVCELTPKEAAAVSGVSRGVLRARLFRGRAKLRREYPGFEAEPRGPGFLWRGARVHVRPSPASARPKG